MKPPRSEARPRESGHGLRIFLGTVLVAYLALTGVATVFVGGKVLQERRAATNWARTKGTILSSGVESYRGRQGRQHRVKISYRYEVDGGFYTGDRVSLFQLSSADGATQERIAERFPVGSTTTVYHDPNAAEEAALDVQFTYFPWSVLLMLVPLWLLGIMALGLMRAILGPPSPHGRGASYIHETSGDGLLILEPRLGPRGWAVLVLGGGWLLSVFCLELGLERHQVDRWTPPALGFTALVAIATSFAARARGERIDEGLRLDRRLGLFWTPGSMAEHRLDFVERFDLSSTPTGRAHKGQPISNHRIVAVTADAPLECFSFQGRNEVAEAILAALESELGRAAQPSPAKAQERVA